MNENEQIMHRFYSAFSVLDYKTMQDCYAADVVFSDPAFGLLRGDEVRAMWEMLCKRARDFSLEFWDIRSEDEYGTCNWRATYTFSRSGRKVTNNAKGYMKMQDGKIIEHSDAFSLHKWSSQAMGLTGRLFGWSGFYQRAVQKSSRKKLAAFIERNMG